MYVTGSAVYCNASTYPDRRVDDILIELQEINKDNYEQCFSIDPKSENTDFVDSVIYSLAEAWVFYQDMKPFAIYQNDKIIGFVSMYVWE